MNEQNPPNSPPPVSPQERLLRKLFRDYRERREAWLDIGTPWVTEGAKKWLDSNLSPKDSVLEFGAGRSSVFWAKRAKKVTIVEASPSWTMWLLMYLYTRPALLKKVRIYFCPAEWNPDFSTGLKHYWKVNREALNPEDIGSLEKDLATFRQKGHNVLFFDGSIREYVFIHQMARINSSIEIIIVDNMEEPMHSHCAEIYVPPGFTRLDFVAGSTDDIPVNAKGKHITSIFVTGKRLSKSTAVVTETPQILNRAERSFHMHQEDEPSLTHRLQSILDHMRGLKISTTPPSNGPATVRFGRKVWNRLMTTLRGT